MGITSYYSLTSGRYDFNAFLLDSLVRARWNGFIPHVDVPGYFFDRQPQLSCSKNSDRIATVWFSNDTLRVKMFAYPHWYITKTYFDSVNDSLRREPKVIVGRDSTVWVCFTSVKNNRQQVFLSKIRVLYIVDGRLSNVQEESLRELPKVALLHQNYPNPFNPTTTIAFSIPQTSFATLKVFDLLGREVATLANEEMTAGSHARIFDGSELASGVYLYRLHAGSFVQTKKLLLLR
jgi:hypothetical protein